MKMRTLAKVLLAVLGVYLLSQVVINFGVYIPLFFSDLGDNFSLFGKFLLAFYSVFYTTFIFFLIFQLLFKGKKWAAKIVPAEEIDANQEQVCKLSTTFRLGLVLLGVFIIYSVLGSMPMVLYSFFGMHRRQSGMPLTVHEWSTLLSVAFRLALGIYLVCGAPHFVRWQVKQTQGHEA